MDVKRCQLTLATLVFATSVMLSHLPLTYVSLLVLVIGAAAIPPQRVHKLSDLVSTHHHAGGQPPHQPPTATIRDAQGQADHGQSSNVHSLHRVVPLVSTETHIPDDAPKSSRRKIDDPHKIKKKAFGIKLTDSLPIHLKNFSKKQFDRGRFAPEADYHKSEEEKERMLSQAKTPDERDQLLMTYNKQKNREKKALFGLKSKEHIPHDLKGVPLEEARARLIATFEGRAEGLFSPELIAKATLAMHNGPSRRRKGTVPANENVRLPRRRKSDGLVMREHHTEPTAGPDHVLPHQTSSDGATVWREVQQHAHEGSSSGHGSAHATQAQQPDSPFLYDFEWPPTP